MAIVSLENITKRYGTTTVIDGLSLSMKSGEFVTLLGPSGCGKSTTLKIIAGLEQPDFGRVSLDRKDVTRLPASQRGIGVVFQSLALFPHLSVKQNVAFGLRMRGIPSADVQRRTCDALELVQLGAFADKAPAQLSGGQQQRVALARAFVIEPAVMLLDEPLSALDRNLREAMQVEIRALTRRLGITTIFVTHDQAEALVVSDRIAVMNHGAIEQIDEAPALFRRPRTAFVADFMGVSNLLEARFVAAGTMLELANAPTYTLRAPRPGIAGRTVRVGLRPNDAVLNPPAGTPGWKLRVVRIIYGGMTYALDLEAPGNQTLQLSAVVSADLPPPAPGTVVDIGWPVDRLLIFDE
jgi:ABC-type Fe3+/spermidine/putrescine transport system ATPase subunit